MHIGSGQKGRFVSMKKIQNGRILAALGVFLAVMLFCTLLSKAIYASGLPQVETQNAKTMTISHEVQATGMVKPTRELALCVQEGLQVEEVFVMPGDRVEEGQLLFTLDTGYLQERIGEKELEIKKRELQIATLQGNLDLAGEAKNRQMQRALEDGALTLVEAQKRLERAWQDEEYAERELSLYVSDTPEGDDEEVWKSWEEGRKELDRRLLEARREREDAEAGQAEAYLQAGRGLEDNFSLENADAELGVEQMEVSGLREELAKLRSILQQEGKICAAEEGTVTQVHVRPGEKTTDSAAVIYADTSSLLQFEAVLDKEQKKYVEPGAQGSLVLGNFVTQGSKKIPVTVDFLGEADGTPGSFTARMFLPAGSGSIGQGGTFLLQVQSERFPYCISMNALHQDEYQRSFVYVLEETDTVLGRELVARKRMVEVMDFNGKEAAVAPGGIDETDEVITGATADFGDGDVVRRKE